MKRARSAYFRLILLAAAIPMAGCTASTSAWLAQNATDQIHVRSLDPQTRLYVDGQFIGKGSGIATVPRDRTSTITAEKNGCATVYQDTGSEFNSRSIRDYTNGAPLLGILGDSIGVSRDVGRTAPLTYTLTPSCPPAA